MYANFSLCITEENEPFVWCGRFTSCRWRSPSLKQHVYSSWYNVSLWYQREVKRIREKTLQRRLTFNTLQWQRCQSAMQMSLITIGWPVTQLTYQTPWKPSPWWDLSSMVTKGDSGQEKCIHRQRKVVQYWLQFVLLPCSKAHWKAQRQTEEESFTLTASFYRTRSRGHKLFMNWVSRLTQSQQLSEISSFIFVSLKHRLSWREEQVHPADPAAASSTSAS